MVPGAATGAGAVPGPCPSVGVVMAAVVCWPLTRRVKMPQNQGKCFIARYKLQRRSWNNNGAPNGGRATHTERERERVREGDRVRERVAVCRGILQQQWQHFLRSRTHTQRRARSWQMPWQSDVQSQKAYVLRIESCSDTGSLLVLLC